MYSEPSPNQVRLRKPAKIIHITKNNDSLDLAILEIKDIPNDIQPLTLAANSAIIDQDIRIVGHPFNGKPWSVVRGYISAKTSSNLQLDANLAEGNSGSPVLDQQKQVVRIVIEISNNKNKATTGGFGSAYPMEVINQQLQSWGIK